MNPPYFEESAAVTNLVTPPFVSSPASLGARSKEDSNVTQRVCRLLCREIYAFYVGLSCLVFLKVGENAGVSGVPAWRMLLELAAFEVVLVDVLCKKHLPWKRPNGLRNGFPSGHATFSFALATLVGIASPQLLIPWLACAGVISWSRVQCKAHFAYQVAGGATLGVLLALLVHSG